MSRKSSRPSAPHPAAPATPATAQAGQASRRGLFAAAGAAALLAAGGAAYWLGRGPSAAEQAARRPELASPHAPTLGDAAARVHVVEFLDPACETCAAFYPIVKRLLAEHPGKLRLSVRHVPFHRGSEDVVRMLEASRAQGKYWQTLEALLAAQADWAPHHTAQPALALRALAGVGLDLARLQAEMRTPEIEQRIAQDLRDAEALQVTKTPEYFVNGRQMPSFGRQQLLDLVRDALQRAY